ncbi:GTP-binding protein REM 2 isoform X3 [Chelonia mydas]|uniref:GTP-binding protein REM 2 isoform X3 n=1 Tax=Chelonia mydas TaxID=8469 RepID=UPI001CA950D3|nr:GTP-binding protein REM 2 isoform X3 [Chelonia mydas]
MALPPLGGLRGPRRGSLPLPSKHQLRREAAVEEPDSPPESPGGSPGGPYRVVLAGESGVGKTALAGIFGGLPDGAPREDEHPGADGGSWGHLSPQGEAGSWLQESCLQTGDAFLLVFSVTDRRSFSRVPQTLLRLREGSPHPDPPVILVGNKSDLARSREVSLEEGRSLAVMLSCKHIETSAVLHHNTRELFEGAVRQIRLRHRRPAGDGGRDGGPGRRRESLTKKAKRFLSSLVPRNGRFFKQRSKSCNDLSVL